MTSDIASDPVVPLQLVVESENNSGSPFIFDFFIIYIILNKQKIYLTDQIEQLDINIMSKFEY